MPLMTDIILLDQDVQPAIAIQATTSIEELPRLIGKSYQKLSKYLEKNKILMAGIPFVAYRNMDMQNLKVEIGFPVRVPVPEQDEIIATSIQCGLRIVCIFRGPYSQLEPVYEKMQAFMDKNGLVNSGPVYECYWNGPEFSEEDFLTEIVMPVIKKE